MAIAVTQGKASRGNIWAPHLEELSDPPRRMSAGANDGQRTRANPLRKLDQPSQWFEQFKSDDKRRRSDLIASEDS
jgi:hypothetical protein